MSNMLERLRAEQAKRKASNRKGGGGFLKLPKEGTVKVRILPAKDYFTEDGKLNKNPSLFYKKFGVHWFSGKKIICPKHTTGDDCPICEAVDGLYKSGKPEDLDAAKEFKVKKKHWVNVVNLDETEQPIQIFEFGVKLLDTIIDYCLDDDYYDLSDPEKGFDFKITREIGENGFPNYDKSKPVREPSTIADDKLRAWLEQCVDIHDVIENQVKTYEEIENEFNLVADATSVSNDDDLNAEDFDADELTKEINESV